MAHSTRPSGTAAGRRHAGVRVRSGERLEPPGLRDRVVVEEDDHVAGSHPRSRVPRSGHARLGRCAHADRVLGQHVGSPVRARPVHDDDLERAVRLLREPVECATQALAAVERRHDDAEGLLATPPPHR
jgi:hypothetical protein